MATKPKAVEVVEEEVTKSAKVGAVIGVVIAEGSVLAKQTKKFTKETAVPVTKKSFWDIVKGAKASYARIQEQAVLAGKIPAKKEKEVK